MTSEDMNAIIQAITNLVEQRCRRVPLPNQIQHWREFYQPDGTVLRAPIQQPPRFKCATIDSLNGVLDREEFNGAIVMVGEKSIDARCLDHTAKRAEVDLVAMRTPEFEALFCALNRPLEVPDALPILRRIGAGPEIVAAVSRLEFRKLESGKFELVRGSERVSRVSETTHSPVPEQIELSMPVLCDFEPLSMLIDIDIKPPHVVLQFPALASAMRETLGKVAATVRTSGVVLLGTWES